MSNYRLTNLTSAALHVKLTSGNTTIIPGGQFVVVVDTEISPEATALRDAGLLDISLDGATTTGNPFLPATQVDRLALSVDPGFICQQQDNLAWYMLVVAPASDPASWREIVTSGGSGGIPGITPLGTQIVTSSTPAQVRSAIGLGNSSTLDVGSGSGQVAAGNHTHGIGDISGLSSALASKVSSSDLASALSTKLDKLVGFTPGSLLAAGSAGDIVEFGPISAVGSNGTLGASPSDTYVLDMTTFFSGRTLTTGVTVEMLLQPAQNDSQTDYQGNYLRAVVGAVSVGLRDSSGHEVFWTPPIFRTDEPSWRKASFLLTIRLAAGWGTSSGIPVGYAELTTITTSSGLSYLPTPPSTSPEGPTQGTDPGVPTPPTPPTGDLSGLPLGALAVVDKSVRRAFQPNATVLAGLGSPVVPGQLIANSFLATSIVLKSCNASITNVTIRTA